MQTIFYPVYTVIRSTKFTAFFDKQLTEVTNIFIHINLFTDPFTLCLVSTFITLHGLNPIFP